MRPIGYSTGALARGDVARALALLAPLALPVIELSALRLAEVAPLLVLAPQLDLSSYRYVSVHAPSRYSAVEEPEVIATMQQLARGGWSIVVHPDTMHSPEAWRSLGDRLVIENMDKRKPIGRTVVELQRFFACLPEAGFCFDLGHARQVDRTMTEADGLIRAFRGRLRQLHVSEVTTQSRHDLLSYGAVRAFQKMARWIDSDVPVILETPARPEQMLRQLELAGEALA